MYHIKSPLNYIGGKEKLLSQIFPLFPHEINTFVDLFCGGCSVGVNVKANKVIFNDKIPCLIDIYNIFKNQSLSTTIQQINSIIRQYNLSINNKKSYLIFRKHINSKNEKDPIEILVAIFYGFNNQIRFNTKGDFMTPSGKGRSSFNDSIRNNLERFVSRLQKIDCEFTNKDFRNFDFNELNKNDFVYLDPPYILGDVEYSRQGGWNDEIEQNMYDILLDLNNKGIKWGLSNVIQHKGKYHQSLDDFIKKNNFNMILLDKQYDNANYRAIKKSNSKEILVVNYTVKKKNTLF